MEGMRPCNIGILVAKLTAGTGNLDLSVKYSEKLLFVLETMQGWLVKEQTSCYIP